MEWQPNATNTIRFVLVDSDNLEVAGLGASIMVSVCVPGTSTFVDGAGTKSELAGGWYQYVSPAAESATMGQIAITSSGLGTVMQNLVYVIGSTETGLGAIAHTVTVMEDGSPVDGAEVWITSDAAGAYLVAGTLSTNAQGNATFYLDAGTYYVWAQKAGINITNPTQITVS